MAGGCHFKGVNEETAKSLANFTNRIRVLTATSNFGNYLDRALRDRFHIFPECIKVALT